MIKQNAEFFRPRVLIVDDNIGESTTARGRSVELLAKTLEEHNVDVVRALSYDDAFAVIGVDASLRALLLDWNLGEDGEASHAEATRLLYKMGERHTNAPVFLLADRESVKRSITLEAAEMIDEFIWLLEDTADFIAGRVLAAIRRYEAQLLPAYARALSEYAKLHEYSWSAPGHQGGVAFTKLPVGRVFFDFLGESIFRIDMGIERGALSAGDPDADAG